MKDFRKLKVWEKSHRLTLEIYKTSTTFPREQIYGLTSQIRRSSSSIPTNIAEGCGRGGDKEFAYFLQVAMGSASEVEYQLLLAYDLGYLNDINYSFLAKKISEIKQMLTSFIKKLKADR